MTFFEPQLLTAFLAGFGVALLIAGLWAGIALGRGNRALAESRGRADALNAELLELSRKRAEDAGRLERLALLEERLEGKSAEIADLTEKLSRAAALNARLETVIEKERATAGEKIALLTELREQVAGGFRETALSAMRDNHRAFLDLAETALGKHLETAKADLKQGEKRLSDAVTPVRDALTRFGEQVRELERARENAYGGLSEKVVSLAESQQALQKETGRLVKALRLPHVRGRWGELTLRRVAELSGMQRHCDFFEQTAVDGGALRPDMVIHLPGGRCVVVDAKAPLSAYLDALEADDPDRRDTLMAEHARQTSTHVRQLSRKAYWKQVSPTPEFVALFIPGESFFAAALEKMPGLLEQAAEKGVILATPTTLIALLKTVALGWRQESVSENAAKFTELGRVLFERIAVFAGNMDQMGRDLEKCVATYNRTVGSLERRVLSAARKFSEIGDTGLSGRSVPEPAPLTETPRPAPAGENGEAV